MSSRADSGTARAARSRRDRGHVSGVPAAGPPRKRRGRDPARQHVSACRTAAAPPRCHLLCPLRRAPPRGLHAATATDLQARRLHHGQNMVADRGLRTQAGCKGLNVGRVVRIGSILGMAAGRANSAHARATNSYFRMRPGQPQRRARNVRLDCQRRGSLVSSVDPLVTSQKVVAARRDHFLRSYTRCTQAVRTTPNFRVLPVLAPSAR